METISTVGDLIEALGGTTAVARLCGRGVSAVSNWKARDALPDSAAVHHALMEAAARRDLAVVPAIWARRCEAA